MVIDEILIAAAGVGLLLGIGLGMLLRGRSGSAERARADQLEAELQQTREELEVHRDDVARHFGQTSDLFRDMTEQYTRLYAHLASGARSFSTGDVPALGQLDSPLLGSSDETPRESAAESPAASAEAAAPEAPPVPPTNGGAPH